MLGPKAHTDPLLSWQLEDNFYFYISETCNDKKSFMALFCYGGILRQHNPLLIGGGVF